MIWEGELVVPGLPQHAQNSLGGKVSVASLLSHICPGNTLLVFLLNLLIFLPFSLPIIHKTMLTLQIEEEDDVGAKEGLKTGVKRSHCGLTSKT